MYLMSRELAEEIRERLGESLPEYMVPAYMMQIESIPVTRNGKLDKRALPEIETKNTREYVAPRNEAEEAVCNAFSEILNVEKVGIQDSFFGLGGDSIKAIRIISKLRNAGYSLTVRDLMSEKIVTRIATKLMDSESFSAEENKAERNISKQQAYYLESKNSLLCRSVMMSLFQIDINKIKEAVYSLVLGNKIFRTFIEDKKVHIHDYVYNDIFSIIEYKNDEELYEQCRIIDEQITKRTGNLVRFILFNNNIEYKLLICGHASIINISSLFTLLYEFVFLCQNNEKQYVSGVSTKTENKNETISIKNVTINPDVNDRINAKNTTLVKEHIDNVNIRLLLWLEQFSPWFRIDESVAEIIMESVKESLNRYECEVLIVNDGTDELGERRNYDIGFYEREIKRKASSAGFAPSKSDKSDILKIAFCLTNVHDMVNMYDLEEITFKDVFLHDAYDIKINVVIHEKGADLCVTYDSSFINGNNVFGLSQTLKTKLQHMISDSDEKLLDYSIDLSDKCNEYFTKLMAYNEALSDSGYSNEILSAPSDFLKSMGRGDERNVVYPVEKKYGANKLIDALKMIVYDQPSMRCCYDFDKGKLAVYKASNNITIPLFKASSNEYVHEMIECIGECICSEKVKNKGAVLSWIYILDMSDKYLIVLNVSHAVWDGMCDDIFRQLLTEYLEGSSENAFVANKMSDTPIKRDYSYFINALRAFDSSTDTNIMLKKMSHYSAKVNISDEKIDSICDSPLSWGAKFIYEVLRQTDVITNETEVPMFIIHHNRNAHNSMNLGCVCDVVPVVYNQDDEMFNKMFVELVDSKHDGEIFMDQVDEEIRKCSSQYTARVPPIVINYHGTHSSQIDSSPFKVFVDEKKAEQQSFLFLDFDIHDNLISLDFNSAEKNCEKIGLIIKKILILK